VEAVELTLFRGAMLSPPSHQALLLLRVCSSSTRAQDCATTMTSSSWRWFGTLAERALFVPHLVDTCRGVKGYVWSSAVRMIGTRQRRRRPEPNAQDSSSQPYNNNPH
jgi:hypothetical protein